MVELQKRKNEVKESSYKNNLGKSQWELKVKSVQLTHIDTLKKQSKDN